MDMPYIFLIYSTHTYMFGLGPCPGWGPYGPIWALWALMGPMGPYGPLWALWAHMGPILLKESLILIKNHKIINKDIKSIKSEK